MTVVLYRNILTKWRPTAVGTVPSSYQAILCSENGSINSREFCQLAASSPASLPSLPVPQLTQTVDKFLSLAKPIQTALEFEETLKLVRNFLESNETKELQRLLEERATKMVNWLTPWWLDIAYLGARSPLPVVTSPGITFPHFRFHGVDAQLDCAAKIIQAALAYHHIILSDALPVDKGHFGVTFDMSQYKLMFGTTRIPRRGKDAIRYGKDQPEWAKHILVTRNGHTFSVPVYGGNGERPLAIGELVGQLRAVLERSEMPKHNAVNVVSSADRDTWATMYERIKGVQIGKEVLHFAFAKRNPQEVAAVENALFVLSLDRHFDGAEQLPADRNMAMALHGGGSDQNTKNRWFDKTLQFHINERGYGGITYEHTPAEGPPLSKLLDFICEQIDLNKFDTASTSRQYGEPRELDFTLKTEDDPILRESEQRIDSVIRNLEVRSLAFDHFGKSVPKRAGLSPDSWIQLALQLTYFRLHGRHAPAYETGSLRKFADGRTDTIRQPSMESKQFVEAFSAAPISTQWTNAIRLAVLMQQAVEWHKRYSRDVMKGFGMDRHLLGLRLIAAEHGIGVPALLQSAIYQRLMHFLLSTSQVPTAHILPMGFGPSAPDCYGVCYNPQEHRIFFTLTAFNECAETSADRFSRELEHALLDMRDLADMAGLMKEKAKI